MIRTKIKKYSFKFKELTPFLIITLTFLLVMISMLPLRNLAFDDDFAYIQTAERLHRTGQIKVSEWASSAVIFQTLWGTLFTKIFGFSIKTLHVSNLVLFYIAIIFFYKTLRILSLNQIHSLVFTILLLSYPWVLQFSFSFMSDVFYMSLLIISVYFYIKALKNDILHLYLIGSLFASFAFLTRQIGISIPFAIAIVLIYRSISEKKVMFKPLLFSLFPFALTLISYYIWQNKVGITAGHYTTFVYPFHKDFLKYIWPLHLGQINATNSLYIELLIQRVAGYINTVVVFLFPVFLIFKYRLSDFVYIKRNLKLICFLSLIVGFIYLVDFIYKSKFSHTYPNVILMFDSFLDWRIWWNRMVFISIPIWIILCVYTLKNFLNSFFNDSPRKLHLWVSILPILYFIYLIIIFMKICLESYPSTFSYHYNPVNSNTINDLGFTIKYIYTSGDLVRALKESWFFLLIVTVIIGLFTYLLKEYRIKFSKNANFSVLFIGIIFVIQIFFTLILAHYYWDQYVIQFIPLFLIWISYSLKERPINFFILPLVLLISLTFSIQMTRNRYQAQGVRWELATILVENGVDPYHISDINWAWRPYWYFEKTFEEAVEKEGGNKYTTAIKDLGRWSKDLPYGDFYLFYDVPVSFKETQLNSQEVVISSKPYWVFSKNIMPIHQRVALTKAQHKPSD